VHRNAICRNAAPAGVSQGAFHQGLYTTGGVGTKLPPKRAYPTGHHARTNATLAQGSPGNPEQTPRQSAEETGVNFYFPSPHVPTDITAGRHTCADRLARAVRYRKTHLYGVCKKSTHNHTNYLSTRTWARGIRRAAPSEG
jgi:hypothetical protein